MTVRVIAISDEPIAEWSESLVLPPGEIGEFVVRGPVVTKEYFHRPEATKLAKIRDSNTGDILHRMGDVGYLDEQGRLWFCGRKSHRVVTPWGTLFTDQVEPVFDASCPFTRTALVGIVRKGITYPVLCVQPGTKHLTWEGIERVLRAAGARQEHTRAIATFLAYPGLFPVDVRHNSKIFREKLAVWADKVLGKHWKPADIDLS